MRRRKGAQHQSCDLHGFGTDLTRATGMKRTVTDKSRAGIKWAVPSDGDSATAAGKPQQDRLEEQPQAAVIQGKSVVDTLCPHCQHPNLGGEICG